MVCFMAHKTSGSASELKSTKRENATTILDPDQNISLSLGLSQENLSFVNPGPQIINYL